LTANFKSKLGQSLNNANGITYVSYGGIEEVKKFIELKKQADKNIL